MHQEIFASDHQWIPGELLALRLIFLNDMTSVFVHTTAVTPPDTVYTADRQKGRYDKNPQVGDQVFFQTGGEIGHTGIVVEVNASSIVTVEGNSSDQVKKNTNNRSSSYIAGYGHPLYSDTDGATAAPIPSPAPEPALKTCDVKAPLLKRGNTGSAVKNAQTLLSSKGFPCGGSFSGGREIADGDFGPTTEKSVKSFQDKHKLSADGIIGSDTWKALLTE